MNVDSLLIKLANATQFEHQLLYIYLVFTTNDNFLAYCYYIQVFFHYSKIYTRTSVRYF